MDSTTTQPAVPDPILEAMTRFTRQRQASVKTFTLIHDGLIRASREPQVSYEEFEAAQHDLFSAFVISTWAALEAYIDDFLVAWLLAVPSAREVKQVAGLKGLLAPFWDGTEQERAAAIVTALRRETSEPEIGIPFTPLLKIFGLEFSVPKDLAQQLNEMRQTRHSFAHGRTHADTQFVRRCPTLKLQVGDRIPADRYLEYRNAVVTYTTLLICCVARYFGVELTHAS